MEDAIVKLRNIHKTFGENAVLKGVDLDIRKGEVVTLMGPSGTGKTTLLRCINLLERPEQGSIQGLQRKPWFRFGKIQPWYFRITICSKTRQFWKMSWRV